MSFIGLKKDQPSMKLLRDWFSILRSSEQKFVESKLKELMVLIKVELDWSLLQNLLTKWNVETYTFHFGTLELAPTYEEYLQLADFPHRPGILPLVGKESVHSELPLLFRMEYAAIHCLITKTGHIPIDRILTFRYCPYFPEEGDGQPSARAFVLLFVGMILYPFNSSSIRVRAVYLARAILEDRSFIPNLLGETYFGMTKICTRARRGIRHHTATFCLPLLQTWFLTHLGLVGYSVRRNHSPSLMHYMATHAIFPKKSFAQVYRFFDELKENDFYPMARSFHTGAIFVRSRDGAYIPIMGIDGSSYYLPVRVAHQFGGDPEIPVPPAILDWPIELDRSVVVREVTDSLINHIVQVWAKPIHRLFFHPEIDAEQADTAARLFKRLRFTRWE